ncbi:MAG: prolipoprotein diacylglyceryl transferase [Clostridia bacterium]|nr:prolipoprotein diacylglyceryl transferase [Clostridia bacterium]
MLLVLLSVGAIFTFVWLMLLRKRLKMAWYAVLIISILHVLFGVLCVRVFAWFEGSGVGAMSLFGAVFIMPVAYFAGAKLFKRPLADVFDIFAVPMIFTLLCARVNCLFAGCCLGRYIPGTSTRWPTREAEIVYYIVFLAIVIPLVWKNKSGGRIYPVYMLSYGIFRAVVECFREANSDTLFHLSHVWALVALVLGLSIYIEQKKLQRRSARGKKQGGHNK